MTVQQPPREERFRVVVTLAARGGCFFNLWQQAATPYDVAGGLSRLAAFHSEVSEMSITAQSRELALKLIDTETQTPKGLLRVRGEDGIVRAYWGINELIMSLKPADFDQHENTSAWMQNVYHAVRRMLDDATDVISDPTKHGSLYDQIPTALGMFLQTPVVFNNLSPLAISWFDVGTLVFTHWQASNSFLADELRRRKEAKCERLMQETMDRANKAIADIAAKSALENTQK